MAAETETGNAHATRISSDELDYHREVSQNLAVAQAVHQSWAKHLISKYQLTSTDSITSEGEITRGALQDASKDTE